MYISNIYISSFDRAGPFNNPFKYFSFVVAYGAGKESESVMSSLGPESESPSKNKHMHMMHLVDTYVLVVNVKSSMLLAIASCYSFCSKPNFIVCKNQNGYLFDDD